MSDHGHNPISDAVGAVKKGGRLVAWFSDFIAMPGRVKMLANGLEADRDQRIRCMSCKDGRVEPTERRMENRILREYGTCTTCGARWMIHTGMHKLMAFAGPIVQD